jgi:hypothetical protein
MSDRFLIGNPIEAPQPKRRPLWSIQLPAGLADRHSVFKTYVEKSNTFLNPFWFYFESEERANDNQKQNIVTSAARSGSELKLKTE